MWPFSSRSSQGLKIAPTPTDLPEFQRFAVADANLKVWLPQKLADRVNWLSKTMDVSRPNVIRGLLFEHIYGRIAYEELKRFVAKQRADAVLEDSRNTLRSDEWRAITSPDNFTGDIKKSRQRYTQVDLEHLGKSVDDIDVPLPRQLKSDLESIAREHRLSGSSYVRKMLVLQLLGEPTHRKWQEAVGAISNEVLQIEG